ncbi:MAG: hypothetical protein ABEJ06_04465 [Haloarculaceae archaeon]
MDERWPVSWARRAVLTALALGLASGTASAHDVAASRFSAPLPLSLLFAGAGATVALTALWLAVTGRAEPAGRGRRILSVPAAVARPAGYGLRVLFLAGVVAAFVFGVVGRQVAAENFATVFTWPVWFRGVALLALLVGTPWRVLSPWRTVYRGLSYLEGRRLAVLGSYPAALAEWPAVVGFALLIGVVENLTGVPRSPRTTTVTLAVYALAMVGGATLFGGAWLRRADPLGVFYRLFGRVAPVSLARTDDGGYEVSVRPPWLGCLHPVESTALVVFVVATVYTVSFDGFTNTRAYQTVLFGLRDALHTGTPTSVLVYVLGFAGFVVTFLAGGWLVERLGAGSGREWRAATRAFAPTVLPIAAAYEVAHNYPYVLRNLGQLLAISVKWAAPGVSPVTFLGWLSLPVFWGSQVVLIVLGHVVAVVAAHYVAAGRYESPAAARRGHLPLVVLMVGYTVLSLWIISQPVVS